MRSLFLKIFLWFWGTAIVTAIAFVLAFILGPQSVPALWYTTLTDTARYAGQTAIERVETSGPQAVSAYLGRRHERTGLQSCLFDARGQLVSGQHCGRLVEMLSQVTPSRNTYFDTRYGLTRIALTLNGSSGARYIFVTELPAGPRAALGMSGLRIGAQWSVAVLVSGLVCLLLTRYITRPIFHLRSAAQRLATGDFGVRAPAKISYRKDEIGELVEDFNRMAARIEGLVQQQRQLLSDISHELRSPLARLNVALDLGRERRGNDFIFDHIERDLHCLNDMIGRLLTVVSLDSGMESIPAQHINLTELIAEISDDASFESQQRNITIEIIAESDVWIQGNSKLLRSALENVIRNATRYTPPETSVRIQLERPSGEDSDVLISVCDEGPGVPQDDLTNIFRPFFRVQSARDRDSGGTGLGLAIADRVIQLHGGTITARNKLPKGLEFELRIPQRQCP